MAQSRDGFVGKRFGRLTVLGYLGSRAKGKKIQGYWECVCDCGMYKEVSTNALTSGSTRSCGCLKIEANSIAGKQRKTHGQSKSKEYRLWAGMIFRATNKKSLDYKLYGPRGVYSVWEDSFEEFLAHIGEIPKDGKRYSIERIDNNIGYFPGNVKWMEVPLQARNKGQYSSNTSGVTGVCFFKLGGKGSWCATWNDENKNYG